MPADRGGDDMTDGRRDVQLLIWTVLAVAVLMAAPLATPMTVLAQDDGVTRQVLADELIVPASPAGALEVTRVQLAPSERTDSLLLDGPIVVVVQTGSVRIWTRTGATLDGVRVFSRTATLYATKDQTLSVPSRIRFRIRALGCAPAKLLFVRLAPSEPLR